jgi:Xaa-Pro aminopeptidase
MSRAAQISVTAQQLAIEHIGPEANEGDVEAELLYSFRRQGAKYEAYPTIVASGENACTFHYVANSSSLLPGDLVLIDAGCEYQYYASDVTRTYPVSGRFSQYQRQLYDIVLAANKAAIDACRLGASFIEPHQAATQVLVEGLVDLGVLHGDASDLIADESHTRFCPHHTSHWLGLDVHDVGDYRLADTWRDLLPGMVLTVEPGIYIPRDETTLDVPEEYRGIGIRIEDTVLIESESCRVLSGELVKDADEIEALMAGSPKAPLSTVKSRVVA